MKHLKKFMTALCLVLSIALVAPVTVPQVATTTVEAKTTTRTFKIKMGQKLSLTPYGLRGKIKWSSSNKKIAKVNQKGVVTPVKAGKVTITAKGSNGSAKGIVYVSAVLSKTDVRTAAGKKFNLKLKGAPAKVKWTSKNKKIATVNAKGQVTTLRPGKTTIVATCKKKTYKCTLNVDVDGNIAVKKVSATYKMCARYTLAFVKNNNLYPVSVKGTAMYYDANGKSIPTNSTPSDYVSCVEPGKTVVLLMDNPKDAEYKFIVPYRAQVKCEVSKCYQKAYGSNYIKVTNQVNGSEEFTAVATNTNTKTTYTGVSAIVLMYDAQGNLFDVQEQYLGKMEPNRAINIKAHYYVSSGGQRYTFQPATVKVIINQAYVN